MTINFVHYVAFTNAVRQVSCERRELNEALEQKDAKKRVSSRVVKAAAKPAKKHKLEEMVIS